MTGIEPALSAWKAEVLPLHHIRILYFTACLPRVLLSLVKCLSHQRCVGADRKNWTFITGLRSRGFTVKLYQHGTRRQTRTDTVRCLRPFPLPLGYAGILGGLMRLERMTFRATTWRSSIWTTAHVFRGFFALLCILTHGPYRLCLKSSVTAQTPKPLHSRENSLAFAVFLTPVFVRYRKTWYQHLLLSSGKISNRRQKDDSSPPSVYLKCSTAVNYTSRHVLVAMVPTARLELARNFFPGILSAVCLPVSPCRHL